MQTAGTPRGKGGKMSNNEIKNVMKLESLKSSKYSLTSERMGKLVGGAVKTQCTSGHHHYDSKRGWDSSDYTISYTGKDIKDGILSDSYSYWGSNDNVRRNNDFGICDCENQRS